MGVAPALDAHGNSAITTDRSHDQGPEAGDTSRSRDQGLEVPVGDTSGYESISERMLQAIAQAREGTCSSSAKPPHMATSQVQEKKNGEDTSQPVPESVPAYSAVIIKDLDPPSACDIEGGDSMYDTVGAAARNSANPVDRSQNSPSKYPLAESAGKIAPQNPELKVPELPIYSVVKKQKKEDRGRGGKEEGKDGTSYQQAPGEGECRNGVLSQEQDPYSTVEEVKRDDAEREGREGGDEDKIPPEQATTLNDYSTIAECLQASEETVEGLTSPPPPLPPYTLEMNQLSKAGSVVKDKKEQSMSGSVGATAALLPSGGSISDGDTVNDHHRAASPVVSDITAKTSNKPIHYMQ